MLEILVVEPDYNKKAKKILESLGHVTEISSGRKNLLKIIDRFDILIIRLDIKVDKEIIEKARRLKVIGSSTTGLDHIDLNLAEKKGIKVVSLQGEINLLKNVWATPEHTFALILSLIRKTPFAFDSIRRYRWSRKNFIGSELRNKIIGVIGFGRVGSMVARIAKGFKMSVLAYDPYITKKKIIKAGVIPSNLKNLFKKSDIISLHLNLNKKTELLIQAEEFKEMKGSAFFINTSRGKIVNEKALLSALKRKEIAGAALDVMWNEDVSGIFLKGNPLVNYAKKHHNLIITPHIGGTTRESVEKTEVFIAEKIKKYFDNY